ncbi:MAG: biotin/lipoyl-binding protein, partial [Dehalococcoidia bacterium]|nr:biotin/lipoyl-binding protein [Dehalococcoidia bacterium]
MKRQPRALMGGALALLLVGACAQPTPTPQQPPTPQPTPPRAVEVQVAPVRRGTIQSSLSYTGDVRAKATVAVIPRLSARIVDIRVDIGSEVRAGDVLAVL